MPIPLAPGTLKAHHAEYVTSATDPATRRTAPVVNPTLRLFLFTQAGQARYADMTTYEALSLIASLADAVRKAAA